MNYLNMFLEANNVIFLIMATISLLTGFYNYYSTSKFSNYCNAILLSLIIVVTFVLSLSHINRITLTISSIVIILSFLLLYIKFNFIQVFSTGMVLGFVSTFIITAGAVGSPEAAFPSALIGGLACGFISIYISDISEQTFNQIRNDIFISYLPFLLIKSLNVYILFITFIALRALYRLKTS